MKKFLFISIISTFGFFLSFRFLTKKSVNNFSEDSLIVHEWGTFTTLHGSDGKRLGGLYIEEEKLPSFVYQHKLAGDLTSELIRNKGSFVEPLNTTVKMETPVLYFYSQKSQNVSVHVDFPNGSISQWYPQRNNGDNLPENSDVADFSSPFKGWIEWKNVKICTKTDELSNPIVKNNETPTWTTPRETDANPIMVNKETEKFLFYRGLGNFTIPLEVQFKGAKKLSVENKGNVDIPYIFVYEKREDGTENIWFTGKLDKKELKTIVLEKQQVESLDFKEFEKALISQGLYEKEAKAMLKTWETSYFKKPGFRVFWILPSEEVERILPIKISPKPSEIKRVFVGRCDILTPEFEKKLVKLYKKEGHLGIGKEFQEHRYVSGFQERINQLIKD